MIPSITSWFEARRKRTAYLSMLALDDRMLADIGLSRFELRALAQGRSKGRAS